MAKAAAAHSMRAPDLSRRVQLSPTKSLDFAVRRATSHTEIHDAQAQNSGRLRPDGCRP
jgi:hypothetical protein